MIAFLEGILREALPAQAILDVHGVGYEVLIPLSTFDRLPAPGQPVKLLTQLVVRDDAHLLYGFFTSPERDLFRLLTSTVSRIGPKIALNVLSGLSPGAFRGAIAGGDVRTLSRIPGVGKKAAERMVLELKDKVGLSAGWESSSAERALSPADQRLNDTVLALLALGYKQPDAQERVRAAQAVLGEAATVEELVRAALKKGG